VPDPPEDAPTALDRAVSEAESAIADEAAAREQA
jgi:hypothetical protein